MLNLRLFSNPKCLLSGTFTNLFLFLNPQKRWYFYSESVKYNTISYFSVKAEDFSENGVKVGVLSRFLGRDGGKNVVIRQQSLTTIVVIPVCNPFIKRWKTLFDSKRYLIQLVILAIFMLFYIKMDTSICQKISRFWVEGDIFLRAD